MFSFLFGEKRVKETRTITWTPCNMFKEDVVKTIAREAFNAGRRHENGTNLKGFVFEDWLKKKIESHRDGSN